MDDILAKKNRHLFLEEKDNVGNSFIANINKVAESADIWLALKDHEDEIATVSENIDNVNTVAENIDDVNTVADNMDDVNNVSDALDSNLLESWLEQLNASGNDYLLRISALGNRILTSRTAFNYTAVVTIQNDIAANATITLPDAMAYYVGSHMLLLSWNGTVCYRGEQYNEIGETDTWSTTITTLVPLKTGDKLEFRTVAVIPSDTQVIANGTNTLRSLANRFADVVNVKDYGAVGDGETNDTTAFQNAIATGKAVFIPEGSYELTTDFTGDFCSTGNSTFIGGTINGSTILRGTAQKNKDLVNVKDFGAVGDGIVDDTQAIEDTYSYVVSKGGGIVYFPEGIYRITEYFDIYRESVSGSQVTISFRGAGSDHSVIVADFEDSGHAVFYSFPSQATKRTAPTSFEGLSFRVADGVDLEQAPGFIWIYGHGNSQLVDIKMYSSHNTHLMSLSAQNIRCYSVVSWYGGKTYAYKDTSDISFTTAQTSPRVGTVTASSDIFDSSDVGKGLTLVPSADAGASSSVVITEYVDARNVKVSGPIYTYVTNVSVGFEPARISITAGSDICSANANCFSFKDVGKTIYIRKAKAGTHGKSLLRGKIIELLSSSSVRINVTADNTVSNEFFGLATIDFFNPYGSGSSASSDVKFFQLHIEHYRGIGLVNGRCDSYELIGGKIHGTTSEPETEKSTAALWLDDADGSYKLTFDTGTARSDAIVYACNLNSAVMFSDVFARKAQGQKFIAIEELTSNSGCVVVNGFKTTSAYFTPEYLVADENSPSRCKFFGVSQAASSSEIYSHISNNSYIDNNDSLHLSSDAYISNGDLSINKPTSCKVQISQSGERRWAVGVKLTNFYIGDESGEDDKLYISSQTGNVYPNVTETQNLGVENHKWKDLYVATPAISDSDQRIKTNIVDPSESLMKAWGAVNFKVFKFIKAVEEKGDAARLHVGIIAQDVEKAFEKEGLNARDFGLFCYDEWENEYDIIEVVDVEAILDEFGNILTPAVTHLEQKLVCPAGNAYSIRYEEALALECAYQRWLDEQRDAKIEALMQRISALENNQ